MLPVVRRAVSQTRAHCFLRVLCDLLPARSGPGARRVALQFYLSMLRNSLLLSVHELFLLFTVFIVQREKQAHGNRVTSCPQIYTAGGLIWVLPKPIPRRGLGCRWLIWEGWGHKLGDWGSEAGVSMTLVVQEPGLHPAEGPLSLCGTGSMTT